MKIAIKDVRQSERKLTLDRVIESMASWRAKKKGNDKIPEGVWDNIFSLAETHSLSSLCRSLGLSHRQYQQKVKWREGDKSAGSSPIGLCRVSSPVTCAPSVLPSPVLDTIVVEFCRADGQVMKLHTTQASFKSLLNDFYQDS